MEKNECLRERVEARIHVLAKARSELSDRIFREGRTPSPGEWRRLERLSEKLDGLHDILSRFCRAPEAPVENPLEAMLY